MSLVNKMLRDLDARRAGTAERGPLPTAVSPLPVDEGGNGRKIALGIFAVLGLGLAAALQFDLLPLPRMEHAAPLPVSVAINPPPPVAAAPVAVAAVEALPAPLPAGQEAAAVPTSLAECRPEAGPFDGRRAVLCETPVSPAPTLVIAAEAGLRLESQLLSLPPPTKREPVVVPKPEIKAELKVETKAEPKAEAKTIVAVPRPVSKPEVKPEVKSIPAPVASAALEGRIDKQPVRPPAMDRADAEYRQGSQAQRQGNAEEALTRYRRAVADHPEHLAARQALAGLLIELHRYDDADAVLRSGIESGPARITFATMLARLKVERGDVPAALDVLLQQAAAGEKSADYQGFVAALLNRLGRHGEAATRYRLATRIAANEGRWWAGLGIALDAEGKTAEAREAYQRARGLPGLSADLVAHIDLHLKAP